MPTPHSQAQRQRRTAAATTLLDLFKSLPLHDRLAEGGIMALQAVGGASLAYQVGSYLHTEQAFWAAITAIAVSQHHYADTRHLSRDQFVGAMIGAFCGLGATVLGHGSLLAYGAAVAAAILICWIINIGSAARLGGVTATIMLLVPSAGPAWEIALLRLGQVTLGTLSALAVSWLIGLAEKRLLAQQ